MPPASVPVDEFLRAIWGDGPGFAELTSIGPRGVKSFPFTYPESLQALVSAFPNHNKDSNVYMGVVLRKEKWPRNTGRIDSQGKPVVEYRGTEDNALSSNCVAFVEIDFTGMGHKVHAKTIPEEEAKKRLHSFPRKPSIVIKSGGGIQMYWLGKEPISGDDLWRMKAINKAIAIHLGADTQSVDLARILRIPGSVNVKYTPPRPCVISWWHPEYRYTLDDFDFLPVEAPQKGSTPIGEAVPGAPTATPTTNPVLPTSPSASSRPNPAPKIDLEEEQISKIGDLLGDIWVSGMRHEMAMCIAGMLVNRGVKLESARGIVARASNKAGGETEKRLKDVSSTYEKWYRNEKVTGATDLEAEIRSHTPAAFIDKALSILEKVKKLLPKPPSSGPPGAGGENNDEPNFKIVKIVKFNSKPARWRVTLEFVDGSQHTATVETTAYLRYGLFQDAFADDTDLVLMDIKNATWKAMLTAYGPPEVRETPKESRPEGAIESALDEFMEEAKENADVGMLKAFAGFDEVSQYFRFAAFDNWLKNMNLRIEHRVVHDHLKKIGFENTTRRFGPKTINVWIRKALDGDKPNANGNGHGNGHPKPGAPSQGPPGDSKAKPKAEQEDRPLLNAMGQPQAPPAADPSVDAASLFPDPGAQDEPGSNG